MKEQVIALKNEALESIKNITHSKDLEDIRIKYLGKKGELTSILKQLGTLSADERPVVGGMVNEIKNEIENIINETLKKLVNKELNEKLVNEKIDITLDGRKTHSGVKHPLRIVLDEIEEVFLGLGFDIAEGPEIESDYYNFKAMNFEDDHPARDAQDTLYVNKEVLFRTHTSPVQARTMKLKCPDPIRVICPGRVFRRDAIDPTHSPQFHQIEGLVVDKNVKFSDLIGTLELFAKRMFGDNMKIRLRPSFFPFTEPSVEVDVSCIFCGGKGCSFCKQSGWLEILGAGSVHPNVLRMGGYDPDIYSGFAFGMGLERITELIYQINDIRYFFENDIRFLHQFK